MATQIDQPATKVLGDQECQAQIEKNKEAMSAEERAQVEAEWEDFKASMNTNRFLETPLFP